MKTKKERYQYTVSETSYKEMQDEIQLDALRDGAAQGLALAMWVLETDFGWKGKRLMDFYNCVNEALHFPDIFGKEPDCGGIIDRMREKYGIDIDELGIRVEVKKK